MGCVSLSSISTGESNLCNLETWKPSCFLHPWNEHELSLRMNVDLGSLVAPTFHASLIFVQSISSPWPRTQWYKAWDHGQLINICSDCCGCYADVTVWNFSTATEIAFCISEATLLFGSIKSGPRSIRRFRRSAEVSLAPVNTIFWCFWPVEMGKKCR